MSWHIEVTNTERDDLARSQTAMKLARFDGRRLRWTLPDRLIYRGDVFQIVIDEMVAEIEERYPL
jgi:hypothetical protein